MESSMNNIVESRETVFAEILEILLTLNRTNKLKHKLEDVVKYLSDCGETKEDASKLPYEFRMIRLIHREPDTLTEFLNNMLGSNSELNNQETILGPLCLKLKTRGQLYEKLPASNPKSQITSVSSTQDLSLLTTSQDDIWDESILDYSVANGTNPQIGDDFMVTKIITIAKEWIFNGTFDEVGEREHCHRALVAYLTDPQDDGLDSDMPKSLPILFFLIESGNIEELINELRGILINLRISRPMLFQDNFDDTQLANEKVLKIVNEFVLQGSFEDLGDNIQCMLAVSKYLTLGTNGINRDEYTDTCDKILSLYETSQTDKLNDQIRQVITTVQFPKFGYSKAASIQYSKENYEEVIKKVLKIVTDSIENGAFNDIFQEKTDCCMNAIAYLAIKEQDLNQQYVLPREHEDILMLHQKGDIEGLVRYLRKLLLNAKETYAYDRIELRVQKAGIDNESNTSQKIENLVAVLGTTFTTGLSTLHVIAPVAQTFKSLIENLNSAFLNPAVSSWPVLGAVSATFGVGIILWNVYCVKTKRKTISRAKKDSVDAAGPMVIASVVGTVAAFALASIVPPIWLSLLIFGGIGVITHCIVRPLVMRFSQWYFFELPENKAINEAYTTLNVHASATDEELRRAYRIQSRRYHPDMRARSDGNEDFTENLLKVQRAYEFLISIRLRDMKRENQPGFFTRVRKFMANMWKSDTADDNENVVILPIENNHLSH